MELRHLRYFLVAAQEENLHRAAARLNVAQPALSRQIRDLEDELGATLFDRQARRVRLSAIGALFLEDVRKILQDVDEARARVRRARQGQVGRLHIAFNSLSARHGLLSACLNYFRLKRPEVELKLTPMVAQNQIAALRSGAVDAGFLCFRPEEDQSLSHIKLMVEDVVLAMPKKHPLAGKRRLRLQDLTNEPFVYFPRSHSPDMFDRVVQSCLSGGLSLRIVHEAVAEEVLLGLVSVGMGMTFVPASLRNSYPDSVCYRPVDGFSVPLQLDLVWQRTNSAPALPAFIESVRLAKRTA